MGKGGVAVKIFLLLALAAILFIKADDFSQFGRKPTRQQSC